MNCATIAEGLLAAAAELVIKIPLVVRMEGTNVEEGKALLAKSDLKITTADSLEEAAAKIVKVLHGHSHK